MTIKCKEVRGGAGNLAQWINLMRLTALLVALVLAVASPGCAVTEARYDQDKIRTALLDLYTNQVIDNLILAANGMPFIQLDYSNATATVTVNQSGSIVGAEQVNATRPLNKLARMVALALTFQSIWTYTVGAANTNQIALTANPAINNDEIYDAYLEYLAEPGSLQMSCDPPPKGAAHIYRKWRGNYYWVPNEYRMEFLRLALLTTAQRGRRLLPVPDFYAVSIKAITDSFASKFDKQNGVIQLTVKIDKKVPNDTGRVDFDINGKTVSFQVNQFSSTADDPLKPDIPPMTDQIVIVFNAKKWPELNSFDAFKAALPVSAKLFLAHSRPDSPPGTEDLLQNVRFQLEQIRFNQLRP
jgi:hypothetical protein